MEEPPEVAELMRELGGSLMSEAASSGGISLPGCAGGDHAAACVRSAMQLGPSVSVRAGWAAGQCSDHSSRVWH